MVCFQRLPGVVFLQLLLLIVVLCLFTTLALGHKRGPAHKCMHDHIAMQFAKSIFTSLSVDYDNHPFDPLRKKDIELSDDQASQAAESYNPIRIHVDYSGVPNSFDGKSEYVIKKLVPAAVKWLSSVLSVVRVSGNLKLNRVCEARVSGGQFTGECARFSDFPICGEAPIPKDHLATERLCKISSFGSVSCSDVTGGPGIAADYILYVRMGYTGPGVLAYAAQCSKDRYDRPIAGFANFGTTSVSTNPDDWEDQINIAIHEIMHALGFSSSSFPFFRDSNGAPRTPRDSYGYPPFSNGRFIASTNTVKNTFLRGKTVAMIVTPAVVREVKTHFNCLNAEGAELEDYGGAGTAGSHLEQRIFFNELMCGTANFNSVYSRLSLAVFEDSGWYKVNYDNAQVLTWGKNEGCKFLERTCDQLPELKSSFCSHMDTLVGKKYCTIDRTSVGVCGIFDPADFCPVVRPFKVQGTAKSSDCRIESNAPSGVNYHGEIFGSTSRCFESTLVLEGFSSVAPTAVHCHKFTCTRQGVLFYFPEKSGSTTHVLCPPEDVGKSKPVRGYSGSIVCPTPSSVCSGCYNDCNGRGSCVNYTCKCTPGWTGSYCDVHEARN